MANQVIIWVLDRRNVSDFSGVRSLHQTYQPLHSNQLIVPGKYSITQQLKSDAVQKYSKGLAGGWRACR